MPDPPCARPHLQQRPQARQPPGHAAREPVLPPAARHQQAVHGRPRLVGAVAAAELLDGAVGRPRQLQRDVVAAALVGEPAATEGHHGLIPSAYRYLQQPCCSMNAVPVPCTHVPKRRRSLRPSSCFTRTPPCGPLTAAPHQMQVPQSLYMACQPASVHSLALPTSCLRAATRRWTPRR